SFIVQNVRAELFPDATFIIVDDVLKSFQKLAKFHRKQFDIPIIGITGSNGKTIVKAWLYQLLSPEYDVCRSPKSYNSQIGVPLSLLQLESHHNIGIFEAGISTSHEMESLEEMIQPTLGIFTNIGPAHDAGFENYEAKIDEKLKLFKNTSKLIYCAD